MARSRVVAAIDAFSEIGARFEEARTRLDFAAVECALGECAREDRETEAARALFVALGLSRHAGLATNLLAARCSGPTAAGAVR